MSDPLIKLIQTKRTDVRLLARMMNHYSHPKGFVGRNICYACICNGKYYGHIVAGSATRFLPGRDSFLGITKNQLNNVINNVFFNICPVMEKYPHRNFTTKVIERFVHTASKDWEAKYGDSVLGFETLIELPRTGELYRRAGWVEVGITKGYTCKRTAGVGTDNWSGKRVWNTKADELRPKRVLCYRVSAEVVL